MMNPHCCCPASTYPPIYGIWKGKDFQPVPVSLTSLPPLPPSLTSLPPSPSSPACLPPSLPPSLPAVVQLGEVRDWRALFASRQWNEVQRVLSAITYHGHAMPGPDGVCVALWALVTSWGRPEQALVVAATFGGSVPLTSQLTGVCVRALLEGGVRVRWPLPVA